MLSLFLCSVFIVTITLTLAAQNFVKVSDCPKTAYEWDMRSKKKNCLGDSIVYLCAAIENKLGLYGEICTHQRWIPENECVILNAQTHNMDSVDCKADTGCPKDLYLPSDLWRYKICFENFYGITTTLGQKTTPTITIDDARNGSLIGDGSEGNGSGTLVGVVVAVFIILFIVAVVMVFFYVRNQFGFKDKVQKRITNLRKCFQHGDENLADAENGEAQYTQVPLLEEDVIHVQENETSSDTNVEPPEKKIKELKKYLAHILKQKLGVNDLKEKVVIHSKSVNEHFSEQLIKDLQSLKDINDYSQLDTSLVFALLRNFCEGIKPPSRGWDYEPPDDETHVGADIERIRSMWNKYCDNDFQFKHLKDVYKRIKQKYGTVAVLGDDGIMKSSSKDEENTEGSELMKEKISSKDIFS
nr:uncharacterized protein LOC117693161 [Crassostrea gigas]